MASDTFFRTDSSMVEGVNIGFVGVAEGSTVGCSEEAEVCPYVYLGAKVCIFSVKAVIGRT